MYTSWKVWDAHIAIYEDFIENKQSHEVINGNNLLQLSVAVYIMVRL